ncbi:hypothetical protein BGZ83_005950 [Gryganskiella cystojenkinii]|nr:hypothetical protein BGZ83_005950 [Gryganskiella cystojenkinii]
MVDAGSMGSRIHTYKFNYCNATPELEDEVAFGHVEPGLSSYGDDPEAGAQSLDKLMDIALESVPKYLHSSTPIAVKATAGLRLMGDEKSNKILAAVRGRIESKYPFPIIQEQGVAVMDGAEEGVFAWVTVNYLLERFNSLTKKATVAILDMGGASTQVVFEPQVVAGHSVAQGGHRYPMTFNGNQYVLYQHSHLGYGLMMARSQINNYLVANPINMGVETTLGQSEYSHPCLPVGYRQAWTTESGEEVVLVGMSDRGGECRAVIEAIFYKHRPCTVWPCSFNGVYQPSLHTAFEDDIYAFSFFFDLTAPFRSGTAVQAQEMTIEELEELTDRVCNGDEDDFIEFQGSPEAMKELGKSTDMCMDLTYIYGLLEYGYSIPKDRKIKLAKKLKGYETGWCVGASIAVLEERNWYQDASTRQPKGFEKMESSFWNKLKKTIIPNPKEPPSSAFQLSRFNTCWLAIQKALSTLEKRNVFIQQTEIPARLKTMIDLLVDEESRLEDATGTTGVCMEYLLKNNILTKLVHSAEGDNPRGIMGETIRSMASMINLLDDRFLVHNAVHKPIVKLLRTCCAPGTEVESNESYHEDLVDLMYVLCSKIHGYPELLNIFFYDKQWLTVPERIPARRLQKNRETMALLRNLSHRSGLSSLGSVATDGSSSISDQQPDSLQSPTSSITEVDSPSPMGESLSDLRSFGQENEKSEGKRDYEFLLFTYLSKFVHREGKSGDFARTGLLFLMELATGSLGEYILDSDFASYLTAGVGALYSQLPRKLIVEGGFESLTSSYSNNNSGPVGTSSSTTEDTNKDEDASRRPSRRANIELSTSKDFQSRLDAFLKVLEFCQDVFMRCPNTEIATTLLASFKTVFLENVLYPSILECSDTDGSSVAVISYIDLILQVLEHEALVDLVVGFLMASDEDETKTKLPEVLDAFAEVQNPQTTSPYFMATGRFTLKDLVLSRLKSRSQPTVIATLKLLNTVITRHCKYSIKLLTIQVDNSATSFSQLAEYPPKELPKEVPLINHHMHELDLFFALVSTINPYNTAEIFSNGYDSYLRDAEGSVETHQCFLRSNEKIDVKVPGAISDADRKKQRRRSMKYGHRLDLPEDQTGESFLKDQEKIVEALGVQSCCNKSHGTQPIPMHRLLPSDPLLQILLGTLSHFFAHSVELNLALTGVITSLAVCPYRSLEGWLLFRSTDIKRPAIDRGSEEDSEIDSPRDTLASSAYTFAELDAAQQGLNGDDSDDEETLPFYLSRGFNKAIQENPSMSDPPAFKSFPPFFTMLRTLTQQVDYYRSEIDGFDEYLADRRRGLLPPVEIKTLSQSTGTLSESNTFNPGYLYGSSDSFMSLTGDGQVRPSTPGMLSASTSTSTTLMATSSGAPTSPRHPSSGGHSGPASRVTSPAPQRAMSKTPVQGGSLANPVTLVKVSSPRARKSSSPSSLMSTPSNMSFLAPPGVGGKRNFKSNSTSPLAVATSSSSSTATSRQTGGSNDAPTESHQQQISSPARNLTTSPGPISQPRALWSPSAGRPAVIGGMATAGGTSNASLTTIAGAGLQSGNMVPNTSTSSFTLGGSTLAAGSNSAMSTAGSTSQFGSFGINPLSKIMDAMMIKPLFPDGFVDDSDSDAEEGLNIELSEDEGDAETSSEDDESSEDNEDDDDTDEADREVNSDLQEPINNKIKRLGGKPSVANKSSKAESQQQSHPQHRRESSKSLSNKKQKPIAKEKMMTLTQLLTNVVILEEVVKEVVAIAQVRKGLGVDKVRFL